MRLDNILNSMKKIIPKILVLSFVLVLFTKIQAQDFRAGLQIGMTGTQVTGDNYQGFNKAGFFGGFFVNRPIGRLGEGQLEINFIQKGSRKNAKPSDGIYDSYLLRLNYIEVPVFYKFSIVKGLKVEAGLMLAYLINWRQFDENGEFFKNPSVADFNKFDFSGFAGLNYKINEHWGFSLRYSYSILAIRPKPDYQNTSIYYNQGQYNEVLCTTFQYYF